MCNDNFVLIIVSIIFGTGVLGGITNFFLSIDKDPATFLSKKKEQTERMQAGRQRWFLFGKSVFLSLCASITVPLFLQILSNKILDEHTPHNYFLFAGFCILASFFSKRFLENLYAKVEQNSRRMDGVEASLDKKADERDIQKLNRKVDDIGETVQTVDEPDLTYKTNIERAIAAGPKVDETLLKRVLEEFQRKEYTFRTVRGISQTTGETEGKIQEIFDYLEHWGIIRNGEEIGRPRKFFYLLKYPVKIYSASYGVPGDTVDVTDIIKSFVARDILKGIVSPSNLGVANVMFSRGKELKIHCRIYGIEKELIFKDGDEFDLERI